MSMQSGSYQPRGGYRGRICSHTRLYVGESVREDIRKAHRAFRRAARRAVARAAFDVESDGDVFVPHNMTDWDII